MARDFLIFGPSSAGKTALVGSLELASHINARIGGNTVRVLGRNDAAKQLFSQARRTIEQGHLPLPATYEIQEYKFDLVVSGALGQLFPFLADTYSFTMIDGPGGAIFGNNNPDRDARTEDAFRKTLIARAKLASGFILCIDASDEAAVASLYIGLPQLLADIGLDYLPYERVVICLTKADRYVWAEHGGAEQWVRTYTPVPRMKQLLSNPAFNALRQHCPSTMIGVAWVSAHGFMEDGSSNYDPQNNGLRTAGLPAAQVIASWRPFQVLEPFVFMGHGLIDGIHVA